MNDNNLLSAPVNLNYGGDKGGPELAGGGPSISISCPEVLDIPEDFVVTLRGHRGPIVAKSASRGEKASASTTLHFTCLCSVEEAEREELNAPEETRDSPIDKLFKRAQDERGEEDEEGEE